MVWFRVCEAPFNNWANGGSVSVDFFSTYGMVLVLRGVGPITVGNGYGIKGKNYAALLQGSEMLLGLHCKNLIIVYNILIYR